MAYFVLSKAKPRKSAMVLITVSGSLESDTILIVKWRIWWVLKKNNATNKTFVGVIKSLGMTLYS